MALELQQLRQVIALAEHGSFVRAAAALHISQPALSRSIQNIERRFGSELFQRSSSGVVPTDVARLYMERARDLLRMADELEGEAVTHGSLGPGPLDPVGPSTTRRSGPTDNRRVYASGELITERKRTEDALGHVEARFQSLVEHAPNVIVTVDLEGTILFVNRSVPVDGRAFWSRALEALEITISVSDEDAQRVPTDGPLIVVANHPLGGVDGLALAAVVSRARPDVKLLGNSLLARIPETAACGVLRGSVRTVVRPGSERIRDARRAAMVGLGRRTRDVPGR